MDQTLEINAHQEVRKLLDANDLASALPLTKEDAFPEVFATARMVALMEIAAARVLKPLLSDGQLSVGIGVTIQHVAATPAEQEVWAVATFVGMEGKLYKFKVEAFDNGGKVGEGEHTRAIVLTERLLAGAVKRLAQS